MATKIAQKVQLLRNRNFDLGNQLTNESACGYGGTKQQFTNADIYYHPVMGAEAHEVHGGIRTLYLSMGGHDVNLQTGSRSFGFPMSDEINSADGRCRVSQFEWGAIYWTLGGVSCYGKIYEQYKKAGAETGLFGYPVSHPLRISDGYVSFFEHGCMYCGNRSQQQVIEMHYDFPLLGKPWIVKQTEISEAPVISFHFFRAFINENIAGHLLAEIFNNRLFLKPTAGKLTVPLLFDPSLVKANPFFRQYQSVCCPFSIAKR